jgi:undecaprenyl diphosphate synthase
MIPNHIAIIMDGNRRWAREHKLPVLEGHRRVANAVLERLVGHAAKRGIKYMTFWAFSTENWGREENEVKGIMLILKQSLGPFGRRMMEKGVKLLVIGDLSKIDAGLRKGIEEVVAKTKNNSRITVTIALNYGGRDEIRRAVHKGKEDFEKHLDTVGIPDPDFIIRTGGEQRLSGFLLWQSEYSELYFPTFLMPDFTPERLDEAIKEFQNRKRRFGK